MALERTYAKNLPLRRPCTYGVLKNAACANKEKGAQSAKPPARGSLSVPTSHAARITACRFGQPTRTDAKDLLGLCARPAAVDVASAAVVPTCAKAAGILGGSHRLWAFLALACCHRLKLPLAPLPVRRRALCRRDGKRR